VEYNLTREPKLPPKTQRVFDYFIRETNKYNLHPLDWERFYLFAQACHNFRVKLAEEELIYLLEKEGFTETNAKQIGNVYHHIRAFQKGLKRRRHMPIFKNP
jgi:hypothetical protein